MINDEYIFCFDNKKQVLAVVNVKDGRTTLINSDNIILLAKKIDEYKEKFLNFGADFNSKLNEFLVINPHSNDYIEFNADREEFSAFRCPKCRKELRFYKNDFNIEYLVCNKCKYAKEISKTL